jgi:hypothetical protein
MVFNLPVLDANPLERPVSIQILQKNEVRPKDM